jgi:hypothetical protein
MELINRGVVVIKPKPPFQEWVNSDPTLSSPISMENLQQDCTAILVPDFFGPQDVLDYLEPLKPALFEMELEGWNLDPVTWPSERTNEVFDAWFELEVHSMVWDSVDAPIGRDENREELSITELSEPRPKLGRNDSCWCGSGKKYKHCHLKTDQQ